MRSEAELNKKRQKAWLGSCRSESDGWGGIGWVWPGLVRWGGAKIDAPAGDSWSQRGGVCWKTQ